MRFLSFLQLDFCLVHEDPYTYPEQINFILLIRPI